MCASCRAPLTPINRAKLLAFSINHTRIHSSPHLPLFLAPTDHSAMASQVTTVIFFVVLLASFSPCLARDRMMLSDHHAQPKSKSTVSCTSPAASSITSTTSPRQLVQEVAVPSPPAAPGTEVDHPESNSWIPEGSVPSPGIGHHPYMTFRVCMYVYV